MKQTRYQFTSRIARQSDFELIARLCRRAVSPRDYALSLLRETITSGGLFLAWKGKELVGMTNFEKCIDSSGWLSMARTDPSWRRSGVALSLQRRIAAHAQRKGVTTLRLWTSAKNKPSISAIRKGGFKQVCEAAHISYYSRAKGKSAPTRSLSTGSGTELELLLRSKYPSQMNGYLAYDWHFVKANTRLLKLILRKRELYSVGDTVFIQTKPEKIFGRLETGLALLAGPFTDSLRNAKQVARGMGAQNVGGYIPYNKYLLRASRRLGFKSEHWGKHCLVFERKIL